MTLQFTASQPGTLKSVLSRLLPFKGARLDSYIASGLVRVNGVKVKRNEALLAGDSVEARLGASRLPEVPVLKETAGLLAVEKAPGVEVSDGEGITLVKILREKGYPTARACHRLDAGTGGVLLIALNDETEAAVRELMEAHRLTKTYRAVAVGKLPRASDTVRAWLVKDESRGRVRVTEHKVPGALSAETSYRVLREACGLTLARVGLVTGRTHQIRAQFAALGAPLLGDDKYGIRDANRSWGLSMPCLWSVSLEFPTEVPAILADWSGVLIESPARWPKKIEELFSEV